MNTPRTLYRISLLCLLLGASAAQAVSISETPLFLTQDVVPNLVMSFDDSNSMGWGYVPDALRATQAKIDGPRFTAASYNPLAYNPKVEYTVPTRFDGVSYSTSFTQAYVNGFDTAKGYADLSNTTNQSAPNQRGYKPIVDYFHNNQSDCTTHALSSDITWGSCRIAYNQKGFHCTVTFDHRSGDDRIDVSSCTPIESPFSSTYSMFAGTKLKISNAGIGFDGEYTVESVSSGTRLFVSGNFSTDSTRANVLLSWPGQEPVYTAYYTLFYKDKPGAAKPTGCNDSKETDACYLLITVVSTNDQAITGKNEADSKLNFAQWYSFYRTRALASMSAAMRAITSLKTNEVRFAWQAINTTNCGSFGTTCKDSYNTDHENRIRPLDALKSGSTTVSHRTDFYNWLQHYKVDGGTPLRGALTRVGEYFRTSGQDSPYAEDPYISQGTELACRKNFHILFTDGLWNQDSGFSSGGNLDSISTDLPDGKTYTSRAPYRDSYQNTLADVAFKYWATDLRSDLGNTVAPQITDRSGDATAQYWNPKNNPATWQNLVNYPIGLGLGSFLIDPAWGGSTYTGDYSALAGGSKSWPDVISTQANRVYDLWHAAINSRGQFFNADSPDALITAFQSAMASILAANPSAAALAANSTSIQTGTLVYQARFDSSDWHGELLAYPIQGDGSIGSAAWNAANLMPAASSRNIFTFDGSSGRTFTSCTSSLSAAQKAALDTHANGTVDNLCTTRLAWLRGDSSQEARNGGPFRNRPVSTLGDIVNSDPAYVKNEDYGYGGTYSALTNSEKDSYKTFLNSKSSRTPMVYVGANDGMLHAFRADTGNTNSGRELFAFIPAGVFGNLSKLTSPDYNHKSFVDGAPTAGDAYLSGGWKTVLVGGLGAGGKSIYALDISNPDSFSASNVMWEFTDANMGLSFSQPQIARLHNGKWAAIFGNGYNSSTEQAYLYIVDLANGSEIKKIALGSSTGNGLSTPFVHDANNDGIADYVYAGDLQGNLWRVDMTNGNANQWQITNSGNALFVARNASNQVQAITAQPKVGAHAQGGVLVYFGTGIYLGTSDVSNLEVQSFYAVRDNGNVNTLWRSNLQAQTITAETNEFGYELRETSNNAVDWVARQGWYLDLVPPSGAAGERVVSTAIVKYDRVIFVTMIPSNDPCQPGGSSWIMELSTQTGGRPDTSPFDFNNDYKFDSADLLTTGSVATGVKSTQGIAKTPVWLESGKNDGMAFKELSGTLGGIMTLKNKGKPITSNAPQRIYWKQIL